jgi:hypothetical protein
MTITQGAPGGKFKKKSMANKEPPLFLISVVDN